MSDDHTPIIARLASAQVAAHQEDDSPSIAAADARQAEPRDHCKSPTCTSFCGEAAGTPLRRQLAQPCATSTSPRDVVAEDAAPPAELPTLVAGSSPASTATSTPAAFGGSGDGILQNGGGAANASSGGSTGSLLSKSKAAKRHHKNASTPHANRCIGATGSSSDCRSISERCKAARTLAAELMSALMERPPEATEIAQYRASMEAATLLTLSTSPAVAESQPTGGSTMRPKKPAHHDASVTSRLMGKGSPTTLTHSFLEAVLNGRAKTTRALAPGTPLVHTDTTSGTTVSLSGVASPTASPGNGARADQRSASSGAATASKATERTSAQPSAPKPLGLVPTDTGTIPQLLSLLREIALSCASLDTLDKVAGGSASFLRGTDAAPFHTKPLGAASAPVTAAVARGAGTGGGSATSGGRSAAPPTAIATAHPSHDPDITEEERWHRVCAHFEVLRGLVLNEHELTRALDEVLGVEWRGVSTPPDLHAYEEGTAVAPSASPAVSADGLHNPPAATLLGAPVAAAARSIVPVTPAPADHETPPAPSFTAGCVPGGAGTPRTSTAAASSAVTPMPITTSSHTGTNATGVIGVKSAASPGTTLSYSARPSQSRTPPSVQKPRSASFFSAAPIPVAHSPAATANDAASSSMKQLSESSSTYSPSQHVAMMLDRGTTPPPASRTQDEGEAGLANFPSTPLSEAAAPYQPSASLMNTSPHGGNASTSNSAPFHLETREEMLRRRSAAPNAFYASVSHRGTTHFVGGPPSAATTPRTFMSSSLAPGMPPFSLNGGAGGARSLPVSPLMSYSSPFGALPCPYDYLLVLDFEATCEEHPPPNYLYEIIEFPVVVVDARLQRVVAEFHRFVRPRYKRELSPFCQKLTGMRQEDVDTAASLEEVIRQFERWLSHTLPPHARCMFVTDGPMDLREFMYYHSVSRQGIRFPSLFYQFIDVKQTFACFFRCSQGKIKAMLEVLHLPFEGRLHSGLDDARNIASIVIGLLHYGCSFCEVPLNRLPFNGLLLTGANSVSGSAPLLLPPSTAPAASCHTRSSEASPTAISAPYSVNEDDHSR
ncbi:Exonuclease family protein [Leishmania donovani]|uniref:Exonuclease family protein n=2 Tax=Leishmania donovani TaxID=5661 RepID=A0A504Y0B5_LEIDO|nr:Exonuclease family protein [Leishmania donovani]